MVIHIIKEYIEREAKTFCGLRGAPVPKTDLYRSQEGHQFTALKDPEAATCRQCLARVNA